MVKDHIEGKKKARLLEKKRQEEKNQKQLANVLLEGNSTGTMTSSEIRGYKMHIASKRPPKKSKLKISDATRRMWELDEYNFTTFFQNENDHFENIDTSSSIVSTQLVPVAEISNIDRITIPADGRVSSQPETVSKSNWMIEMPRKATVPSTYPPMPEITRRPFREGAGDSFDTWKESMESGSNRQVDTATEVEKTIVTTYRTTTQTIELSTGPTGIVTIETRFGDELPSSQRILKSNRPIKHGFDRSKDEIDRTLDLHTEAPVLKENMIDDLQFQDQLARFTSSALCIARSLFDLWCFCQVLTALPYMVGICVAKRGFFIAHLILDAMCLVIAFIYCVTIFVFSIVLYTFVDEMQQSTLFEWSVFALLLVAIIIAYSGILVLSVRCCEIIIDSAVPPKKVKILDANEANLLI